MNIKNNKGLTLISLMLTVIIILIITAAMIYNTKSQLQMKSVHDLSNDIETLNAKVDEYYLNYGELPKLCNYTDSNNSLNFKGRAQFIESLIQKAEARNAVLNVEVNTKDSNEYIVLDLEKLGDLTLTYGYDKEYLELKSMDTPTVIHPEAGSLEDQIEDEIFVINVKTHQIYFPHGIFVDKVMYYTF